MTNKGDKTCIRLELAIFPSRQAAESAVHALLAADFPPSDISLFVQAPVEGEKPNTRDSQSADPIDIGGQAGAGLGAAAGGLAGMLAGFGLLAVPGVGPVMAVGPLAAALTGAITGGALGGFTGALVGEGVSEIEAIAAERHVKAGRVVVVVQCVDRCEEALAVFRATGAVPATIDPPAAGLAERNQ
jgi:hypothetical protein